jgi:hypothetical protein
MFNLEQSIAEWRKQMLTAGIKTPTPLEELESHLRDETERQAKLGMDEASAFDFALQKIGAAPAIQIEFGKIEKAAKARRLKRAYILLVAIMLPLLFGCVVLFRVGNFSELTLAQEMSSFAALAVFYLMIWCGRASQRIFPAWRARRMSKVVPVLSMAVLLLWWIAFFNLILMRYNFDISHLMVAIVWGFVAPTGAMMGLNLGIEIHERRDNVVA